MTQVYAERSRSRSEEDDHQDERVEVAKRAGSVAVAAEAERTIEEIDQILEDLDPALEANAEEFVFNFRQQGGEQELEYRRHLKLLERNLRYLQLQPN